MMGLICIIYVEFNLKTRKLGKKNEKMVTRKADLSGMSER